MKIPTPHEVTKRLVPDWEKKRADLVQVCAQALNVTGEFGATVAIPKGCPEWVVEMVKVELWEAGWEVNQKGSFDNFYSGGVKALIIKGKVSLNVGADRFDDI
jgi:hypothetical protein